jgi:aldehyde dehydrogenase (NAD+)
MVLQQEKLNYQQIINQQRGFFATGKTKNVNFRIEQLKILKQAIIENQEQILSALKADLCKPEYEAFLSEVNGTLDELNYAIKNVKKWAAPQKVKTSLLQFGGTSQIITEPLGVVLIIGAWNYPFHLNIAPLLAAIAAGNCAIIKPSELAVNTSKLIAQIIGKYFNPEFITVIEGGVETNQQLLAEKFDHIFFTGGTEIGKIVMAAAAKHLTPVTLELGGKSPCIVDANVNIETTAKRIVWGKFFNAGQTCVAPDYVLVDRQIKGELLTAMSAAIKEFYGENASQSSDFGRIINDRHFNRLLGLIDSSKIVIGGEKIESDRYISPTIIEQVTWDDKIMSEEIFGPILPVLEYEDLTTAINTVNNHPKPLALYFFSKDKEKQQRILTETSAGGVSINDTIMHLGIIDLPFGGVGNSGMGNYHGKAGFDTFSHQKGVYTNTFLFDLKFRYAPYKGKIELVKKMLKM